MAKIALLKAKILRMHMAFKDLTVAVTQIIMDDLQGWYDQLPAELHLSSLLDERGVYDVHVRRSIYHVHLLYLGAIILLHRRVASQFMQSRRLHGRHDRDKLPNPLTGVVRIHAEQGVLAAERSASIIGLLLGEDGVYKRCWLVIFQSFASCVIILHSVVQKQLFDMDRASWTGALGAARRCLDALDFCATDDPVAAKFALKIRPFYHTLEAQASEEPTATASSGVAGPDCGGPAAQDDGAPLSSPEETDAKAGYLFFIPPRSSSKLAQISVSLMEILCRPFGDPDAVAGAEEDMRLGKEGDPSRGELPQMVERLEVNYEATQSFRWGMGPLCGRPFEEPEGGNGTGRDSTARNRFLDGTGPHGWLMEPSLMQP
ncbi:hypothetical protein CDD83_5180 [Cordyceps sp. RAO-2017]|nr:hypothetical protein CDD83_5180 [Cordyceps sp. RAO-2017]